MDWFRCIHGEVADCNGSCRLRAFSDTSVVISVAKIRGLYYYSGLAAVKAFVFSML